MFSIQSLLTIDTILKRKCQLKMSDKKYLKLVKQKAKASRKKGFKYNTSDRNQNFEILTAFGWDVLKAEKEIKFAEKVDEVYHKTVKEVENEMFKRILTIHHLDLPPNILREISKKCK
uniref:Uncharacterized protein n=1 Tax=viral metagenome TaxID=1070528 RepID=A0A6C0F7S4_9ZZZZ|tara:strand:- start:10685 stop:11038 length:354 start_codon:yes stop_codon:yes gene_type:complete